MVMPGAVTRRERSLEFSSECERASLQPGADDADDPPPSPSRPLLLLLLAVLLLASAAAAALLTRAVRRSHPPARSALDEGRDAWRDESTPPCDDFFQYACGNWAALHPPPAHAVPGLWNPVYAQGFDAWDRLAGILKSSDASSLNGEAAATVGVYQECVEALESPSKSAAVEALRTFVRGLGGFGLLQGTPLGSAVKEDWNLEDILEERNAAAFQPLVWVGVGVDERNPARQIILIAKPQLTLKDHRVYPHIDADVSEEEAIRKLSESQVLMEAMVLVYNIVTELGAVLTYEDIFQRIIDIYKLESQISTILRSTGEQYETERREYISLQKLQSIFSTPMLDWISYIQSVFKEVKSIGIDEEVAVSGLDWLLQLNALIHAQANKNPQVLDDYIRWQSIISILDLINIDSFKKPGMSSFVRSLSTDAPLPVRLSCVHKTENVLPLPTAAFLVDGHAMQRRDIVRDMYGDIRSSLSARVGRSPLLSTRDRAGARRAVDGVSLLAAFPDHVHNASAAHASANLTISDSYIETIQSGYVNIRRRFLGLINERTDPDIWPEWDSLLIPNAYFDVSVSRVRVPLNAVGPATVALDDPQLLNYASMGQTLGHELGHALELRHSAAWADAASRRRLRAAASCLRHRISAVSNHTISSAELEEALADGIGARVAFAAWARRVGHGRRQRDAGAFFTRLAHNWCAAPPGPQQVFTTHSHESIRVNGMVQDMPEFAEAFGCPVRTPSCEML